MNQQDVFLIHMRELYASKLRNEPVWRESNNARPPEKISIVEFGSGAVSFVVDWQMESIEFQMMDSDFTQTARTESYAKVGRFKNEQHDSSETLNYTNIFEW